MDLKTKKVIIVDDERAFMFMPAGTLYLRSEDEALLFLAKLWIDQYYNGIEGIDELWLDHDLGEGGDTHSIARFLNLCAQANKPLVVESIKIHSMNPVGSQNLVDLLWSYPCKAVPLPPGTYLGV